jgi:hypothetical protein
MNYNPLIRDKIKEFKQQLPEYSFGEMVFSAISIMEKSKGGQIKKSDLLEINDEQFYTAFDKAIKKELE